MGFYFRKSVSFGPIRLNFSKSGIGVSAGVKGARISTGPRGTYIHAGSNGFYYRQRLGQTPSRGSTVNSMPPLYESSTVSALPNQFVIETADVSQLRETSITELLNQINERAAQMRVAPLAFLATALAVIGVWLILSALVAPPNGVSDSESGATLIVFATVVISVAVAVIGSILSWQIQKGDELKRTTPLFYELEPEAETKFTAIQDACRALAHSSRTWRVHTNQPTWDWKRNAGASALITRHPSFVNLQRPPHIATNVDVWAMVLSDLTLFFLPDYVFVRQRGKYGAVSYDSLGVSFSPTRFIEDQGVPPDTQVLDYTWRFVNKKGGPDRRFSNNYRLPIVQYGFLQLESNTGLNIHLNVSSLNAANTFARIFANLERFDRTRKKGPTYESTQRVAQERPYIDPKIRMAFEILGVSISATQEEVVSAYRNMAKIYHPDKLAHLAPEFIELAEERMKEINAAYEQLKRR
jgi:hypothetical protein